MSSHALSGASDAWLFLVGGLYSARFFLICGCDVQAHLKFSGTEMTIQNEKHPAPINESGALAQAAPKAFSVGFHVKPAELPKRSILAETNRHHLNLGGSTHSITHKSG
ncbi:hypothetical protein [Burkholderia cepacia]|uniref:hypothetical protein n=1 Tax=Burkholderia cepacia TaxID=292 RepID=UPI0011B26703|nr:hypothetical protein [Burkholderia cepacia]